MDPKRKHEAVSKALHKIRQLGGDYDAKKNFGNHPHSMGVEIVIGKHEPSTEGSAEEEKSESPLFEEHEDSILKNKSKR